MTNEKLYSRKVSAEESKKGYVFVLKDQLSFFPPRGKPFTLVTEKTEKTVSVESYRCTCRGPDLPHEHYFIRWEGLRFADRVSITKDEKTAGRYLLSLHR
jgi:hypothetical protein